MTKICVFYREFPLNYRHFAKCHRLGENPKSNLRFESLVNSNGYQAQRSALLGQIRLRALLIQTGTKLHFLFLDQKFSL